MNSIFIRRSIRKFKDKSVEPEKIRKILEAAMQAPSAGNQQPWEFIIIDEKDIIGKLKDMSPYSKPIENAPVSILIAGNKDNMKYPENWEQDLGAATQNILIQAVEEGLGSVWLGVSPLEERIQYIKDLLELPENIVPFAIVPIGYSLGGPGQENKFLNRYDEKKVHYNKYR